MNRLIIKNWKNMNSLSEKLVDDDILIVDVYNENIFLIFIPYVIIELVFPIKYFSKHGDRAVMLE